MVVVFAFQGIHIDHIDDTLQVHSPKYSPVSGILGFDFTDHPKKMPKAFK